MNADRLPARYHSRAGLRRRLALCLAGAAVVLTGCTLFQGNLTPRQLEEVAKIKDAHVGCNRLGTPYGNNTTGWANADKGVVGRVTLKCDGMEFTIEGKESDRGGMTVPVTVPPMRMVPQ